MSSVFLTSEDLMGASSQLSALEGEVLASFQNMKGRMQDVSAIWQSPAGDALQEKFASLSPTFDAACQHLEAFASFLNQTAVDYQENESALSVSGA